MKIANNEGPDQTASVITRLRLVQAFTVYTVFDLITAPWA